VVANTTNRSLKRRSVRSTLLLTTLMMLVSFAALSIVGAFLGTERAAVFFGSSHAMPFWTALTLLFGAGFAVARALRRKPGLLLTHLGCLLVLLGAMWGSERAHVLRTTLFGSDKIHGGYLQIFEGAQENKVIADDGETVIGNLPFAIALKDFWIDYYMTDGEPSGIMDYKSELVVMTNGVAAKHKIIELNKPLHYGGYDFCQFDFDREDGTYTVLSVASDSGLLLVYAGYALLCLGVLWQCWLRHIPRYLRSKA
jgi:hypothetical protein